MSEENRTHPEYNYSITNTGLVYNFKGTKLSPKIDKDGYEIVGLSKNNIKKYFRVHRLVAEMFLDNFKNNLQINHLNGIKNDNRVENLEVVNSQSNHIHRVNVLKLNVGESHFNTKFNLEEIKKIRDDYNNNKHTQKELQEKYNVSRGCIWGILNHKVWKI